MCVLFLYFLLSYFVLMYYFFPCFLFALAGGTVVSSSNVVAEAFFQNNQVEHTFPIGDCR